MPRLTLTAAAIVALAAPAAAATAAPVSTTPPAIGGAPRFLGTATCDKGAWSGAPVSFTYAWIFGGNPLAAGPRFTLDQPSLMNGLALACQVTATDAGGASATATSAPVKPGLGRVTVRIASIAVKSKGRFTVTGFVGPKALVTTYARGNAVVLYRRVSKTALAQLGPPVTVSRTGRFVAKGTDAAGRRKVIIRFNPGGGAFGLFGSVDTIRTVKVTKGGRGFGGGSVGIG